MRLLVVTQYFWPETFIINDLVKCLVRNGHEVTILTGKPNYPDGKIHEGYEQSGIKHEVFDDAVDVIRVPLRPRAEGGGKNLILNYLSFVFSGLFYFPRLVKKRKFDVIFVFAPSPIVSAIPAVLLKILYRKHLVIWVQDLWPDSLSATGFVRNPLLLKIVGWLVRGIYAFANTLLIQSNAFRTPMLNYTSNEKIIYYPNSIDTTPIISRDDAPLPCELLEVLENNVCVVFAGNIGKAQAVDTIVEAALLLRDLPTLKLVIVGSGSMLEWMQQQKSEHKLDNLVFAGRFPMSMMPKIYSHASALLVTLKNEEIFSFTIPSKVQAYLAAGKPIIAALNGEGARVVAEAKAGLICPAENAPLLAQTIRNLYAMPSSERAKMGAAGKAYFSEYFEMNQQAKRLIEIIESRLTRT